MKRLLLLFYEPYAGGERDREKTFNPDNTEVKVVVNRIPDKVYSQGMKTGDLWEHGLLLGGSLQKIRERKQFDECHRLLCWRQIFFVC